MRATPLLVAALCGAAVAALAQPTGMPGRRPGEWRTTMSGMGRDGGGMTMEVCVDPARERSFSPFDRPFGHGPPGGEDQACSKRDVHPIPGGWAFSSVCDRDGRTVTTSGRITGDFRSHYHMEMVSDGGHGGERHMTMDGDWVGPCAPGGGATVTLPDGRVITVPGR
jgi:hypothetical protein